MSGQLWVVRAGEGGAAAPDFLEGGFIAVSFASVAPDSLAGVSEDDLRARGTNASLSKAANQLASFAFTMATGDIVLVSRAGDREPNFLVGLVAGDYEFGPPTPVGPHRRPVTWLGPIPRAVMSKAALNTLGAILTVFRPTKVDAEIRAHLAKAFPDADLPGPPEGLASTPGRRRIAQLQHAVFQVLADEPDGLSSADVLARVEALIPPVGDENDDYASSPGTRRYPKKVALATITGTRAGWLNKQNTIWSLTDEGRQALAEAASADEFNVRVMAAYRDRMTDAKALGYDADAIADDEEAAALERAETFTRRAWLVRVPADHGDATFTQWRRTGSCAVATGAHGVSVGMRRADLTRRLRDSHPETPNVTLGFQVAGLARFLDDIEVGDVVTTVWRQNILVGEVTSEPDITDHEARRDVRWSPRILARRDISPDAADIYRSPSTVTEVSTFLAELGHHAGIELEAVEEAAEVELQVDLAAPDQALADQLLLPREWLAETVDLLNEKRQIVLYGPPGTGKTYLAQELCKTLVLDAGGEYEIVQFHPSYAYEDFFEGLRPRLDVGSSGAVTFELVPGPLRRMARRAEEAPSKPFVLIIDEINRANLAKVFGELYFLLEYRGQHVALQYSADTFRLPRNLFVIGTMNTADRSIALVDAAMRRRFAFQGLFPGASPVREMLGRWLEREGLPSEPARLLHALNEAIADEDVAVGPSYLMTPRVGKPGGLERIWRTGILPLLAEHYSGEGRNIEAEFGLEALRARL